MVFLNNFLVIPQPILHFSVWDSENDCQIELAVATSQYYPPNRHIGDLLMEEDAVLLWMVSGNDLPTQVVPNFDLASN